MALVQAENGLTAAAGLPLSGKPQLDAQLAALAAPDSCIVDLDLQWEAIGPQVKIYYTIYVLYLAASALPLTSSCKPDQCAFQHGILYVPAGCIG